MTTRARSLTIVGRGEQLAALGRALDQARAGGGRLVLVSGEAGVGKTRLVHALVERAGDGVAVARGHCFDEDPAEPYGPFRELLRAVLQAEGADALLEAAGPWAGELARLLPELGAPPGDAPPEKRRLFEAIYRVLRPRGQGCRVVLIEDLHWSDQASQELIGYLARAVERDRLLLLGTYRADELHRRHPLSHMLARLTRERLFDELRLAPLAPPELAQLLASALGEAPPPAFADALYERTEGNPFFAEEVLGALAAQGRLDSLLDAARARRRIDMPAIPLSVRDTIDRRMAELDATSALVLRHAAVIGRHFEFNVLAHLTGVAEPELLRALSELVELRLVLEDAASADEDRYHFRHELVREAVLDGMLRRERRGMHREVLRALEELHAGRLDDVVDQLAYHSMQARELDRAARFARLAGDRAVALAAFREALAHYETALEADEDAAPLERADLLRRMGHAAYPLGDARRCTAYWSEAQALYAAAGRRRESADLLRWLGRAAWELGDHAAAFERTRAALDALAGEPPCHELAMAHSALSHLSMLTDRFEEAIAAGEVALALAERLGDTAVEAHALNNIGVSLCGQGQYERGIAALERSLDLARGAGLHLDAVRAFNNLGGQLAASGQLRRSAEVYRELLAYGERTGYELRALASLPNLVSVELALGLVDAVPVHIERGLRAASLGAPIEADYLLALRADLLLCQGQLREAEAIVEQLRPRAPHPGDCWEAVNIANLQAHLFAAGGDMARAAAAADELVRAWEIGGRQAKVAPVLPDIVEILVLAGRADMASGLLGQLEALFERAPAGPIEAAAMEETRGIVLAAAGDPRASGRLRAAAEAWRALGIPEDEGCARRRLAETLPPREAEAELAAAAAVLEPIGAALELARVAALRQRRSSSPRPAGRGDSPLTTREREVLRHMARGASNRAIAEALVISEKTVEVHVSNILGKLGATSRTHAAALAREQGLDQAA